MLSHLIYLLPISALFAAGLFSPPTSLWSPILQVILLCWALLLFFYERTRTGVLEVKGSALPLPLLIFFLLAIVYTFESIDYVLSRDFFLRLVSYAAIFFLVAHIRSMREACRIALVVVILGILTSLYGLYQHLWGFQDLISKIDEAELSHMSPFIGEIVERLEGGRVFSTFLLPSHFAAFLGVSIPLSLAFLVLGRTGWVKCLFGLGAVLQIFVLYLTKSFSGWGSLILACGCFALIYLGYVQRVRMRYLACWLAGLALLLVVIFAGLTAKRPDNPFAMSQNNPMVLRLSNWGTTIDMIKDEPLSGKGLNTYGLIYPSYQRPGANVVHHGHNTYLQLAVEMGIIGPMLFLWFACWWLWRTLHILKESKDKHSTVWVGSVMVAGLAFFIHHTFDFEFYLPNVTLPGFATLALALAMAATMEHRVYRIKLEGRRKGLFTLLGFFGTVAVSIVLLLQLYGQMYYHRAKRGLDVGPVSVNEAALDLEKAIALDPQNSQYRYLYGVLLFQKLFRQKEGIVQVQKAIGLSPWRHYYHFDLGMMYLISGQKTKALHEIRKASALYPLNEQYHQFLKTGCLQTGETSLNSEEDKWIEKIQRQRGAQ